VFIEAGESDDDVDDDNLQVESKSAIETCKNGEETSVFIAKSDMNGAAESTALPSDMFSESVFGHHKHKNLAIEDMVIKKG
jgi:hypothetical protein